MKAFPNYLTEDQAKQLAAKIQQFWHDQGHPGVRVWTERTSLVALSEKIRSDTACFAVRSNLVRGMPQS